MKHFAIAIILWSIGLSAFAQSGLLWEARNESTGESCFIFGTMHLIPKDEFNPSPVLDSIIRESDKVVTEIGLDLFLEERFDLATSMVFDEKKSLKDHISDEKIARLKKVLVDTLKLDENRLDQQYFNLKPMFMSTVILQELIGPTEAYDSWIWKKAQENEKKTGALESAYQQIGFIDSISMNEQLSWLDDLDSKMLDDFLALLAVYNSGNLDSLLTLSKGSMNSSADLQLRTIRNDNWIARMHHHMNDGKVVFAVGALHLPGPKGLLELLKMEGFVVTPISQ